MAVKGLFELPVKEQHGQGLFALLLNGRWIGVLCSKRPDLMEERPPA